VGALLEGDEVVAINGVQLGEQSLDTAMRLLDDRSSDAVMLKIKKLPVKGISNETNGSLYYNDKF